MQSYRKYIRLIIFRLHHRHILIFANGTSLLLILLGINYMLFLWTQLIYLRANPYALICFVTIVFWLSNKNGKKKRKNKIKNASCRVFTKSLYKFRRRQQKTVLFRMKAIKTSKVPFEHLNLKAFIRYRSINEHQIMSIKPKEQQKKRKKKENQQILWQ